MITTVREIRKALRGLGANVVMEITDNGVAIFKGPALSKHVKVVKRAEVYRLYDSSVPQVDIAKRFGVSPQAIHQVIRERNDAMDKARRILEGQNDDILRFSGPLVAEPTGAKGRG